MLYDQKNITFFVSVVQYGNDPYDQRVSVIEFHSFQEAKAFWKEWKSVPDVDLFWERRVPKPRKKVKGGTIVYREF